MFTSGVYDYINILGKAADGAWARNEAISNNLANVNTPGYKRQDVDFQTQLQHALKESKYPSLDSKVADANKHLSRLDARAYTDIPNWSYRMDKNNVDVDTENVTLAANQLKYNGLMESLKSEFAHLTAVSKSQ